MFGHRAILLAFIALPANATTFIEVNGVSQHSVTTYSNSTTEQRDLNERNFGVGVGYEVSETLSADVGFYENSYYRQTWYVGVNLHKQWLPPQGRIAIGLSAGFATGYDNTPIEAKRLQPIAMPTFDLGGHQAFIRIGRIPVAKVTTIQLILQIR